MAPTALDPSQSAHGSFVGDDNSLRLNGMTEAGPTRPSWCALIRQ
jgi:hypothetical protein